MKVQKFLLITSIVLAVGATAMFIKKKMDAPKK